MSPPARPAPAGPVRTAAVDFDPSRDGFSFVNRFEWTDDDLDLLAARLRPLAAVPLALGGAVGGASVGRKTGVAGLAAGVAAGLAGGGDAAVRAVARRWPTFGLCGGMALAAVERWPHRAGTPTATLRPEPLRALLRRRQERTLRAALPRFAAWWLRALADRQGLGWAAPLAAELDRVEARIGAGRPVVLGLVGDAPDPFALHQVVAFAIERAGLRATLRVYDPNAPGQTRTVTTAPAGPGRALVTTTIPTGRTEAGRARISTRPGRLHHLFVIDAE